MDVTSAASVEGAVEEVAARLGPVYVLVNNAGILRDGQLIKYKDGAVAGVMSDEQFDAVVSVNLKGVFDCTRAVAPRMIAAGGGVILNASSVVGLYGNFGQTNYVATKAGVIGMTKVWARELGKYQIRVNAVAPGIHRHRNDPADAGEDPADHDRPHAAGPHGSARGCRQRLRLAGLGPGIVHHRHGARRGWRRRDGDVVDVVGQDGILRAGWQPAPCGHCADIDEAGYQPAAGCQPAPLPSALKLN